MPTGLAKFNRRLEQTIIDLGETVRILTDWAPVQSRRLIRLVAMGLLAHQFGDWLGWDADTQTIGTIVGVALQEVLHRTIAPATPDREQAGQ